MSWSGWLTYHSFDITGTVSSISNSSNSSILHKSSGITARAICLHYSPPAQSDMVCESISLSHALYCCLGNRLFFAGFSSLIFLFDSLRWSKLSVSFRVHASNADLFIYLFIYFLAFTLYGEKVKFNAISVARRRVNYRECLLPHQAEFSGNVTKIMS